MYHAAMSNPEVDQTDAPKNGPEINEAGQAELDRREEDWGVEPEAETKADQQQTGQQIDPNTGQPYDPNAIDPNTGQPYGAA